MTLSRLQDILLALQTNVRLKVLISRDEALEIGKVLSVMVITWRRTFSVEEGIAVMIANLEKEL